jgi:hypothetical protein
MGCAAGLICSGPGLPDMSQEKMRRIRKKKPVGWIIKGACEDKKKRLTQMLDKIPNSDAYMGMPRVTLACTIQMNSDIYCACYVINSRS